MPSAVLLLWRASLAQPLLPVIHKEVIVILIVDDEASPADVLAVALRDEGHQVQTVASGEAALHHLAFHPMVPKLIILDLMLPEMSGVELCVTLQNHPRLAHIPILVMTAAAPTVAVMQRCRPARILHKPFSLETLLTFVATFDRPSR